MWENTFLKWCIKCLALICSLTPRNKVYQSVLTAQFSVVVRRWNVKSSYTFMQANIFPVCFSSRTVYKSCICNSTFTFFFYLVSLRINCSKFFKLFKHWCPGPTIAFPSCFICPVRYMHSPFMSYKVNIFLPTFWLQSQSCLNEYFGIKTDAGFGQTASYYPSTFYLGRLFSAHITKQIYHFVFLLVSISYSLFRPAIPSNISV